MKEKIPHTKPKHQEKEPPRTPGIGKRLLWYLRPAILPALFMLYPSALQAPERITLGDKLKYAQELDRRITDDRITAHLFYVQADKITQGMGKTETLAFKERQKRYAQNYRAYISPPGEKDERNGEKTHQFALAIRSFLNAAPLEKREALRAADNTASHTAATYVKQDEHLEGRLDPITESKVSESEKSYSLALEAFEKTRQEGSARNPTIERSHQNLLNARTKFIEAVPVSEGDRLLRIEEAEQIWKNMPAHEEHQEKVERWLQNHPEIKESKTIMFALRGGEAAFQFARLCNKSEDEVTPYIPYSPNEGDYWTMPGLDPLLLITNRDYYLIDPQAPSNKKEWDEKADHARGSGLFGEYSLRKLKQDYESEPWVKFESGQRLKEQTAHEFNSIAALLAENGYYAVLTSTDTYKRHRSPKHYEGDAFDMRVLKMEKVATDDKREVLLLTEISSYESRKIESLFEKAFPNLAIFNEITDPSENSTGPHFHIERRTN